MSNVVQFLESMGRHPAPLSDTDYIRTVMDADIDDVSRKALLERDITELRHALDARSPMFCFSFIVTPDGGEKEPLDDHEDEGVETPDGDPTPSDPA